MKTKNILKVLIALVLILSSCNKEKRYSQKLMKGEVWSIKYIKINGTESDFHGQWFIQSDVNIYDSVPTLEWKQDAMDAFFEWQFQDKGENIQLNYSQLCSEAEGSLLDTLDHIGYAMTGLYSVERHGRNKMEFKSNSTLGYTPNNVEISLERIK